MVFSAVAYAKLLDKPLMLSYHTHVPKYIPQVPRRSHQGQNGSVSNLCTLVGVKCPLELRLLARIL